MKKFYFMMLCILLVLLTACGQKQAKEPTAFVPTQEQTAQGNGILSSFSATDLSGAKVDASVLSEYDLTMVNVWATFCTPCIREMPELGELANEYKEKGVQIAGIVSDVLDSNGSVSQSQVEVAKDIVGKTNADYLHILPSDDLLGLLSQINSVPTTFFVDKHGNQVGSAYLGAKSKADWEKIIDATMAEVVK